MYHALALLTSAACLSRCSGAKKMKTTNIDGFIQKSVSCGDSAPLVSEDYVYPIAVIISISFLAFALSGGIQL
jgi:hypothetical protein